jgi:hypothetical protein
MTLPALTEDKKLIGLQILLRQDREFYKKTSGYAIKFGLFEQNEKSCNS